MKIRAKTTLLLLAPFVVMTGAARAESDFVTAGGEPDPIFNHGFEAVGAIDCGARPPAVPSRMQINWITYVRGGGAYIRSGDMRVYLGILGLIPPPSGSGPPTYAPFPGNGANQTVMWTLPPLYYAAMEFSVPQTLAASTTFQFQFLQTTFLPHNVVASMSLTECPGDFHPSISTTCKAEWDGNDGGLILMVADDSPLSPSATCRITRGKTYYLNFVGGALASPSSPSCTDVACKMGVITKLVIP